MGRTIIEIIGKQTKVSKDNKPYLLTTVLLSDGTEVTALGEWQIGEEVQTWFDDQYNQIKMKRLT